MNEDDTYRILSRPHISEMIEIWESSDVLSSYNSTFVPRKNNEFTDLIDSFFKGHGWVVDEYIIAKIKWTNREPSMY